MRQIKAIGLTPPAWNACQRGGRKGGAGGLAYNCSSPLKSLNNFSELGSLGHSPTRRVRGPTVDPAGVRRPEPAGDGKATGRLREARALYGLAEEVCRGNAAAMPWHHSGNANQQPATINPSTEQPRTSSQATEQPSNHQPAILTGQVRRLPSHVFSLVGGGARLGPTALDTKKHLVSPLALGIAPAVLRGLDTYPKEKTSSGFRAPRRGPLGCALLGAVPAQIQTDGGLVRRS